ncbi:hypothetical protein X768_09715 [Mesorhizobium sp. LSJC265A00]|nr:hypothetical protein X768_09715 [Mesorhizobium sp. LSJC265A00]ESY05219.1 hypothetical protein X753_16715 [Mesorhizobium sp. LNJC399B00]
MAIIVPPIDRIIACVSISVGANAFLSRIPVIRRDEPSKHRIHVPGIEIQQPGLGIEALADIALLGMEAGVEAFAVYGVAIAFDSVARDVGDHAHRGQVFTVESHNLTTLALDHTAFIDSIVDPIAHDPAELVATTIIHGCTSAKALPVSRTECLQAWRFRLFDTSRLWAHKSRPKLRRHR